MKKLFLLLSCCTMLILCGCEKKDNSGASSDTPGDNPEQSIVKPAQADISKRVSMFFNVGASGQKTALDTNNSDILWSSGDKLEVFSTQPLENTSDNNVFGLSGEYGGGGVKQAKFVGELVPGSHYFLFYPSSGSANSSAVFVNGTANANMAEFNYTLLNMQSYKNGSFNTNALPTVAYTNNPEIAVFSHLCAVLEIWIKTTEQPTQISGIKLSSESEFYPLCGQFSVNYADGQWNAPAYVGDSSNEDYSITMNNMNVAVGTADYTKFYFVIPATEGLSETNKIKLSCLITTSAGKYINLKSIALDKLVNKGILPGDHIGFKVDADDFSKDWQSLIIVKEISKDWPDIKPDPTEY